MSSAKRIKSTNFDTSHKGGPSIEPCRDGRPCPEAPCTLFRRHVSFRYKIVTCPTLIKTYFLLVWFRPKYMLFSEDSSTYSVCLFYKEHHISLGTDLATESPSAKIPYFFKRLKNRGWTNVYDDIDYWQTFSLSVFRNSKTEIISNREFAVFEHNSCQLLLIIAFSVKTPSKWRQYTWHLRYPPVERVGVEGGS